LRDLTERSLSIYMNECYNEWNPMELQHPSTFETLAMDRKQKQSIIDDLDRFIKRKEYYRRIGKAWKRGYLLYGPPGTGKSSLIAAIANHLRFDIYQD
jgi:chaperone BCS1